MAIYTTQVRTICENLIRYDGNLIDGQPITILEIINRARPLIFDNDLIFGETSELETLENKILSHYYMREIGFETYQLWRLKLNETLRLELPYYNQILNTVKIEYNPLIDHDFWILENGGKEISRNGNNTITETVGRGRKDTVNTLNKFADTPQGSLRGLIGTAGEGDNETYLTTANGTNTSNNIDENTKTDRNDKFENGENENKTRNVHKSGMTGHIPPAKLIELYRDNIINIEKQIIDKLEPLFFGLWE